MEENINKVDQHHIKAITLETEERTSIQVVDIGYHIYLFIYLVNR